MGENFLEDLPGLLAEVSILEKPNDDAIQVSEVPPIAVLDDLQAKRLWSLMLEYRKKTLIAYYVDGNKNKKETMLFFSRYNICKYHFWYRVGEVTNLFGIGKDISIRSNWEIVCIEKSLELDDEDSFFLFGNLKRPKKQKL